MKSSLNQSFQRNYTRLPIHSRKSSNVFYIGEPITRYSFIQLLSIITSKSSSSSSSPSSQPGYHPIPPVMEQSSRKSSRHATTSYLLLGCGRNDRCSEKIYCWYFSRDPERVSASFSRVWGLRVRLESFLRKPCEKFRWLCERTTNTTYHTETSQEERSRLLSKSIPWPDERRTGRFWRWAGVLLSSQAQDSSRWEGMTVERRKNK